MTKTRTVPRHLLDADGSREAVELWELIDEAEGLAERMRAFLDAHRSCGCPLCRYNRAGGKRAVETARWDEHLTAAWYVLEQMRASVYQDAPDRVTLAEQFRRYARTRVKPVGGRRAAGRLAARLFAFARGLYPDVTRVSLVVSHADRSRCGHVAVEADEVADSGDAGPVSLADLGPAVRRLWPDATSAALLPRTRTADHMQLDVPLD